MDPIALSTMRSQPMVTGIADPIRTRSLSNALADDCWIHSKRRDPQALTSTGFPNHFLVSFRFRMRVLPYADT